MNKDICKKLEWLNAQYETDILFTSSFLYTSTHEQYWLCEQNGFYVKLHLLYVQKWLEAHGICANSHLYLPSVLDGLDSMGESYNNVEFWGMALLTDHYMNDISMMDEYKKFNWSIESFIVKDTPLMKDKFQARLMFRLQDENAVTKILDLFSDVAADEDVVYHIISHERTGIFLNFMDCHKEFQKMEFVERIYELIDDVVTAFYYYEPEYSLVGYTKHACYSCIFTGYFSRTDVEIPTSLFNPLNIIRAWYLEKYLDFAFEYFSIEEDKK